MKKNLIFAFAVLLAIPQLRGQISGASVAAELSRRGVTAEQIRRMGGADRDARSSSAAPELSRTRIAHAADTLPAAGPGRPAAADGIFGHNIFTGRDLTFEPSLNIATPESYPLGPGDEVLIDIWGESEQTIRQRISPDGEIVIPRLGPIVLSGLTVGEADSRLRRSLGKIYSSVGGASPATFVKLSLGELRSIRVHVMGEVARPGSYTVSSLATLFHVLYQAGGVGKIGSLRAIGISRGGERIATVDVYSYLLEGRTDVNIALRDGDVILVAPYANLVTVAGGVKRPMKYELKEGQTLARLLDYAGGFAAGSYREAVTVVRGNGRLREVFNVERGEYDGFGLMDGDSVAVGRMIDRFANRIEVTGAVFRPGLWAAPAASDSVATVAGLIARAEGLRGDAFAGRALLTRERADYSLETVALDAGAILRGEAPDPELRPGDVLHIPSIFDLRERYTVAIRGAVSSPGDYPFAEGLTVEDMIVAAGGLLEAASTARVDVFRRIKNPSLASESEVRSESFTFPIRNGLAVGGEEFVLRPFDVVSIRTSPGYETQKNVTVQGEVLFPGAYTLVEKEERLSDLVARSGGTLTSAYLRGASLSRLLGDDERRRMTSTLSLTRLGGPDSLTSASLGIASHYPVGIRLDRAVAAPGSDWDLVLREGDELRVPEYVGTVSISGAVLYPNTVSYREGMTIGEYIEQAGGYLRGARRGATIVVYMNGTVARASALRGVEIAPGCEIVVPYRSYRRRGMSLPEILSLGASATSTAALVSTLVGTLKR